MTIVAETGDKCNVGQLYQLRFFTLYALRKLFELITDVLNTWDVSDRAIELQFEPDGKNLQKAVFNPSN